MNFSPVILALIALCLILIKGASDESRSSWDVADEQSRAGQFMNYVYAFDDYYRANKSATGDVTASLPVPAWLPKNTDIKAVISGGVGYVYTPTAKGMMNEILNWTDNSSSVGVTDAASINTPSGPIAKPAFIGSGYIVYVR